MMDEQMMETSSQTIDAASAEAEETSSPGWGHSALMNEIIEALRTVYDPEIPVNVFDLGLIYRIDVKEQGFIDIDMTLTALGCPVAGEMLSWVKTAVNGVTGVADTKVNLVFDPPWDQSNMSEEAKLELGLS